MKKVLFFSATMVFPMCFGILAAAAPQESRKPLKSAAEMLAEAKKPAKLLPASNATGRFTLFFGTHARADQYLVDTQTGRVWQLAVDKEGNNVFQEIPVQLEGNARFAEVKEERLEKYRAERSAQIGKALAEVSKTVYAKRIQAAGDKILEENGYSVSRKDTTRTIFKNGAVIPSEAIDKSTLRKVQKAIEELDRQYPEDLAEYNRLMDSWKDQ